MLFLRGDIARKFAPAAYGFYLKSSLRHQRKRIARLLLESTRSLPLDADRFDGLSKRAFARAAAYEYDQFSSIARASGRIQRLATLFPMLRNKCDVLEVSCGDGLTGALISHGNHDVILSDIRDWRLGNARQLDFALWNVADKSNLAGAQFDLIVAYNATEHWEDPATALTNLLSLCKPGGFVLLDFGPLFNSPWGLHAWSISFPYPQFLFSRELVESRIRTIGVNDLGTEGASLQPTNGWSISAFRDLWRSCGAKVISNIEDRDFRYLNFVEEFSSCFKGRNVTLDDLTVNSIEIVLQKI
jgi:SAM-dependent methyltransferase